ncbi:MAG TPA: trypsin-like peptidase domain-containing protein [Flavisolibacter sp.]
MSDLPNSASGTPGGIAEQYRKKLSARGTMLESANEGTDALPDSDVQDRSQAARENLYRVIKEYLGDKKELYELAERATKKGSDALRAVANNDDLYLINNPQSMVFLEVIVRTDGSRPSFMVRNGKVDKATSPVGDWSDILDASEQTINEAIACVGRIDYKKGHVGTGFLIHENLVVTNRHVLQAVANKENDGTWRMKPQSTIDFGYEFRARTSVNPRELESVVFSGNKYVDMYKIDHDKLDMAIIRLKPVSNDQVPRKLLSLNIAPDWATEDKITFTIGYPGDPGVPGLKTYGSLLEQLFKSTFGCKRLAPGQVTPPVNTLSDWGLAHDTTTLGGNSGSVILAQGKEHAAAGLHYGGQVQAPRENWGHIIGKTLNAPDSVSGKSLKQVLDEFGVDLVDTI